MIVTLMTDLAGMLETIQSSWHSLLSLEWYQANAVALFNVMLIDLVLAGDNAIIVGLAASRAPKEIRSKVIFWGIAAAVILRILFASITVQLLAIVGLTLAGGLLLLFVCWKMYRQIVGSNGEAALASTGSNGPATGKQLGFWTAVWQIMLADVAMSLDNVLAVAGAAKDEPLVLVIGLTVSIVLMAIAAHLIASLLVRHSWITWVGLLIIVWVALDMIYSGSQEVACQAINFACSETLADAILHRLGLAGG